MSTIFSICCSMSEFSLQLLFILAHSCSNFLFIFTFSVGLAPEWHLKLSFCQLQIKEAINQLVRPYNQGAEYHRLLYAVCTSVYPRTPYLASTLWESALHSTVLIVKGCEYAKAGCQDCSALPELSCPLRFVCASECMACLSSSLETLPCTTDYMKNHSCGWLL